MSPFLTALSLVSVSAHAWPILPPSRSIDPADGPRISIPVAGHPSADHFNLQPPYAGPGYTDRGGGTPTLAFPANGVRLLAWLPIPEFDPLASNANTCWGYVSPAGREYAIVGLQTGTGFVDITDPGDPTIVAFLTGPTSLWRDMKVYENYCYAVSEGGQGIQVFNLANIDAGVVTFVRSVTTGGGTATHTMFVNEESGYLYRCGGGTSPTYGIRIYDLNADPSNPAFVGQWNNRYIHECQVVNWTTGPFAGREIAFVCGNDVSNGGNPRINILDVTNKAAITQISEVGYPNSSFSHQAWLSPDRRYMYHNDELDENAFNIFSRTRIFDMQNLAAPAFVGFFSNGLPNIDHNLYTRDNLIFEANYRAGLRVFDATNPLAPVEIAFFDTYLEDDAAQFNGLWCNYPYFPSGTVIGSDIEKGLFVWRLGPPEVTFSYPGSAPSYVSAEGGSFFVQITPASGQSIQPASPMFVYDAGAGPVSLPLTPIAGDLYSATFPPLTCGSFVPYYVTARTGAGLTVRDPAAAPNESNIATIATNFNTDLVDTFETNSGWSVGSPTDTATSGIWIRADPVGTGAQPEDDATVDPAALCWITGNGTPGGSIGAADVDGGATTLTSTTFSAIADPGIAIVTYARWYSNNLGGDPNNDSMPIEISNNNGASWTTLELVTENAGAWVRKSFRVQDFVTPTDQMRLRFIARDLGAGSVVEAGVDDFFVSYAECLPSPNCNGDSDGDGNVDFSDITSVLANFGMGYLALGSGPGDADRNNNVNFADITTVLANFGMNCP